MIFEPALARALDDCIAAMRAGAGLEECLERYPHLQADLRPLLEAAARVSEAEPEAFPDDARRLTRARVMAGIRTAEAARPAQSRPEARGWERWLLAPAAIGALLLALFLGLTGTQAPDQAEAAAILTVLQGDVRVETANGAYLSSGGEALLPGDRVVTSAGARAVLTFPDGSTVTMAPETSLVVNSVLDAEGQVSVHLTQERGNTWTYIPPELGSRRIEIDTPTARVETRDGSFETNVEPSTGRTEVDAGSGSLAVSSGSQRTEVVGGSRTSVDEAGSVAPTAEAVPPPRELVIRVSGPAYGYITDPSGATVGVLAPGYSVSQVPGATVTRSGDTIEIRIPDPADGAYAVGVVAAGAGSVQVGTSANGGEAVTSVAVAPGQAYTGGLTLAGDTVDLGALAAQGTDQAGPPNVVVPDSVKAAATSTAVKAQPTATVRPPATDTPRPAATPTATSTPTKPPAVATPLRPTSIDSDQPRQLAPQDSQPQQVSP